jgi:hypothetical protein
MSEGNAQRLLSDRARPRESLRQMRSEMEELRRELRQNDQEIEALQLTAAREEERSHRPWYREGSLVIAMLALLFSFGTTVVSYARLDQEGLHEARNELTGYLQRLGELPRLAAELQLNHGEAASAGASGFFNAEMELIANQALAVMNRIPDQVTTTEYLTVGSTFSGTGALAQADELFERGLQVAKTPIERITALRFRADLRYLMDDVEGGRELYREARGVFGQNPIEAPALVAQIDGFTEIRWAGVELNIRECDEARRHADEAERITAEYPLAVLTPLLTQLREQLQSVCG